MQPRASCFRLFVHWARRAASRAAWTAGNNSYGNFMHLVAFPTHGEEMEAARWNQQQWKEFSDETASRFQTIKFSSALPAEECVPTLDKAIADLRATLQSW